MKKAIGIILAVFLTGCGGGGAPVVRPGTGETGLDKHVLTVNHAAAHAKISVRLDLANRDGFVINLARNGKSESVRLDSIKEIIVNGNCLGWPSSGGQGHISAFCGVRVDYLPDLPESQIGLFSLRTNSGEEYFLNTDFIELKECTWPIKISSGLIYWGEAVANPNFSCPVYLHKISVSSSGMEVAFNVSDGKIIDLVKDGQSTWLDTSKVHRVFWNGDAAQWSLGDMSPYGAPLQLSMVTIPVPSHDAGIVRLVDTSGAVYSINTSKCQLGSGVSLSVDGRQFLVY